jgi:glycosyltransferase involved in cell wall biosynthesis
MESGADITLLGSENKESLPPEERGYNIKRFRLPFRKGFLFYAFYNLRLLFYLLTRRNITLLVSCDLDTLPANYLASVFRKCPLVYDSHEYFTEVPELQNRKFTRNFWLCLEKFILPKLKYAYTVSESIAKEYTEKYKVKFSVIRNLPLKIRNAATYPLPGNIVQKKKILYQGVVNTGRGLELMMDVAKELNDDIILIIAGEGDLYSRLKNKAEKEALTDKVYFTGRIPHEKLPGLTAQADLGISMEENTGKNYRYALPNKLFDYIQAEIPVMVSDLPEMRKIVEKYNVGIVNKTNDKSKIKEVVEYILFNEEAREVWKKGLCRASSELIWEKEKLKLIAIFTRAGLTFSH